RAEQLRAIAVDATIGDIANAFMQKHDGILDGGFDSALVSIIPHKEHLDAIREACLTCCYEARDVLRIELAGAEAISGLLRVLFTATDNPASVRGKHLRKLMPALNNSASPYEKVHRIVDHVSGMTDRYCVSQYREFLGMRYPGTRE